MFYEGAEKRLEITIHSDLFLLSDVFWKKMVEQAGASILSSMKDKNINAYLLSESSLFVWKNKLLLITCGETHLLNAALFFLNHFPRNDISSILFQRHEAFLPQKQKSHFEGDCAILNTYVDGAIQDLPTQYKGNLYQFNKHHLAGQTQQILMLHQLSGEFSEVLQEGNVTVDAINQQLQLVQFFEGVNLDAFSFDPKGYSVNGVLNNDYFTLHITPEKNSTYLSFESSLSNEQCVKFNAFLIELFQPQKHYLLRF